MNIENQTQYILLGAVLTFSEYADVLQDLKIDDFCPELRDTFAAICGYWEHNDKWNPVEVMGRYDNCKKAMGECLDAFGAEPHYHFALEKNKEGNVGSLDITFQMETQQFKECVWM